MGWMVWISVCMVQLHKQHTRHSQNESWGESGRKVGMRVGGRFGWSSTGGWGSG